MSDSDEVSLSTELEMIGEMWGSDVYMVYRQEWNEWVIRNTTDEGLPVGVEGKEVRAPTLEGAIEKIKQEGYDSYP